MFILPREKHLFCASWLWNGKESYAEIALSQNNNETDFDNGKAGSMMSPAVREVIVNTKGQFRIYS